MYYAFVVPKEGGHTFLSGSGSFELLGFRRPKVFGLGLLFALGIIVMDLHLITWYSSEKKIFWVAIFLVNSLHYIRYHLGMHRAQTFDIPCRGKESIHFKSRSEQNVSSVIKTLLG